MQARSGFFDLQRPARRFLALMALTFMSAGCSYSTAPNYSPPVPVDPDAQGLPTAVQQEPDYPFPSFYFPEILPPLFNNGYRRNDWHERENRDYRGRDLPLTMPRIPGRSFGR